MKLRPILGLLAVVACSVTLALPARAAWTPLLPGWTATEVSLPLSQLNVVGSTLDPVTGDLFVVGSAAPVFETTLLRITRAGATSTLTPVSGVWDQSPAFSPVSRLVYVASDVGVQRFDTDGGTQGAYPGRAPGPIAATSSGAVWSVKRVGTDQRLQLQQYDEATGWWNAVKLLPALPAPWTGQPADEMLVDESDHVYLVLGGAVLRADDTQATLLGSSLLAQPSAIGSSRLFQGAQFVDPNGGSQAWTTFAAPTPSNLVVLAVAVTPEGDVLLVSSPPDGSATSLTVFTPNGTTPTVRSSWGTLKAGAR